MTTKSLLFLATVVTATLSTGASVASWSGAPRDLSETRVVVSRREMRVVFPRETATTWGWPASADPNARPMYRWSISVGGIDGPEDLGLWVVGRDSGRARSFPSLKALVAAGQARRCSVAVMLGSCSNLGLTAHVDDGRVVLVLRDSARVAALFGLRQGWVRPIRSAPGDHYDDRVDSARVEYIAPFVPDPTPALRAEWARRRLAFERRISHIGRYISHRSSGYGDVWMVSGDSVLLRIVEGHCRYDHCVTGGRDLWVGGWTVADSSVARLHPAPRWMREDSTSAGLERWLVARRPGRTTFRVHGLRGPSDSALSDVPPAKVLEQVVNVTEPIERLEIGAHPDTIRVNEGLRVTVRALDRTGRVVDTLPVPIRAEMIPWVQLSSNPAWLHFWNPGRRMIVATFGGRADTSYVTVLPRP